MHYLLAIDQGTTNSRAIIFNSKSKIISQHELPVTQYFPHPGWVEQDPQELFTHTITCCQEALKKARLSASSIAAIGISNQRETTIIWDKHSGLPIYPAIVWQDRRTVDICEQLAQTSLNDAIQKKTGLLLDPYFSATKIVWLLNHVKGARERAERGELLFGTVDTFLLWKLTNKKAHATDATNASRTMLFNIHTQEWDKEILDFLDIPNALLPAVFDNTAQFGEVDERFFGAKIAVAGMAGDQQAATVGQACFHAGMVKVTYGTGCFMLLNTGENVVYSQNQLLSTIAYRIEKKVTYGLEGSIFSAGSIVKWLRDTLKVIKTPDETESLAQSVENTDGVYLVPAFTGLGAPYWNPQVRGALLGLTRNSGIPHIVRAGLESVGYQTRDLLMAMRSDTHQSLDVLRVDGGMVANNWFLQFIADILNLEVQRPTCIETSALGAAYLAGLQIGMYASLDDIANHWQLNTTFYPQMDESKRLSLYDGWKKAVERLMR